jgi:hypothetical protein
MEQRGSETSCVLFHVPKGNISGKLKLKCKNINKEIQRTWNTKCFAIPVIIGATGIATKGMEQYL